MGSSPIEAIIFDLDGLLVDSEVYWERARTAFCAEHGCAWGREEELTAKGRNSPEWAALIKIHCGFDVSPTEIIAGVAGGMRHFYAERLPLLPGAVELVRQLGTRLPLAVASSSPPGLIQYVLTSAGIRDRFRVLVSADDVGRGKPNPDVFLVAARELGIAPSAILVFEDSSAGINAALAAGMRVVAVPNAHYPPAPEALERATCVLTTLADFSPEMLSDI